MLVLIEAHVPTVDVNRDISMALWKILTEDKRVEDKKLTTQTVFGVAESKIFFGITVRDLADAFTIGYDVLRAAWRQAAGTDLRIITISFRQMGVEWTKTQEELNA